MTGETLESVWRIDRPRDALPLILDSPHSGRIYPADFHTACTLDQLRGAEDNEIDRLFGDAPAHGASLLRALFPRTYIDPNRAAADIDDTMLTAPWPGAEPSARAQAGIGLLRRLLRPGVRLYDRRLTPEEVQARLDTCYHPYHAALAGLLDGAVENFGAVWHVNCHAMPSHHRTDIVLGDRDGTSCAPDFTGFMQRSLTDAGFRVARNDPYKGVEILRRYGAPRRGRHSLQLEINKGLYWNEAANEPNGNFMTLKVQMDVLAAALAAYVRAQLETRLAAD